MNELSIQACFKVVGIGVNCWQCRIIVTVCGATNEGRLFRWTIFLHIIFVFQILLEQNQGRDFPDFRLPHNVCDRWRCNQRMEGRKGMTLQLDEKGRRGEGYCLITQSQATTLGWYFMETMNLSNCQKRFARWCLFSILCYVSFWEFCWAQFEMFDLM